MYKSLRILIISLMLVFFAFTNNCLAVNIDMNLPSNSIDDNLIDTNNVASSNYINSNTTNSNYVVQNSVKASNIPDIVSALPESELGLTNILDILLIAVGVVLILLAIAIFIKLK